MEITIYLPVCFSEPGDRTNNEDCVYPWVGTGTASDQLFLVCDGVGGEHKGEVASHLACTSLSEYFENFPVTSITKEYCEKALEFTRQQFEDAEKEDPDTQGMATTLTLLSISESGIVVAYLGDSRVYQIREGKILFKTKDHKWVNELIETGLLTKQQALEHPKRNVITRVISAARNDQPDFTIIEDVKAGDYFFMCTDGVLEQVYDELLQYHLHVNLAEEISLTQIIESIKEECEGKTGDNFSAYLIRIAEVNQQLNLSGDQVKQQVLNFKSAAPEIDKTASSTRKFLYPVIFVLSAILLAAGIYYYIHLTVEQNLESNEDKVVTAAADVRNPATVSSMAREDKKESRSSFDIERDHRSANPDQISDSTKSKISRKVKIKNRLILPDTLTKTQTPVMEEKSQEKVQQGIEPQP